ATSAFEEQTHALWTRLPSSASHNGERFQPPGQIILTHAHTGHYVGLWQLDRSVMAATSVRVVGPPLTIGLLRANEPWKQMERDGFITLESMPFGEPFEALPDVQLTHIEVPHRSEWTTDTAAIRIDGPNASVLYVPDIDSWDEWDRDLIELAASVDVALVDGCFWQAPNRAGVPHPPIAETMDRLQGLADSGSTRVLFTHLNHSNPALTPGSVESREVERRGFCVACEGDRVEI
ncbi:MAG TPA: MBL fold metallo-hydrolase, partial [Thermomicrobiales bacterium]|nr:MBL fold metallo-hydrolase [Thermomicrobiales bacterium]